MEMKPGWVAAAVAIMMITLGWWAGPTTTNGVASTDGAVSIAPRAVKDDCVVESLKMPKVAPAFLKYRGNPRKQVVGMAVYAKPLPKECRSSYDRTMLGEIFMKNGVSRHRVRLARDMRITVIDGGKVPDSVYRMPAGHNGWPKKLLYKCTPGPRKTKVYGVIDRSLVEKATGKQVARKVNRVAFKVRRPGPC